jgi:excinuclease ABC subunit C
MPDLILVDGGKGQLSAVHGRLKAALLAFQPVASLAKRLEEVFIPGQNDALMIPKRSPALHLLQRIRDEAHRFAVTFHRKKRGNGMTASALDDIKGIGANRKQALLKKFGSLEEILKRDEKELVEAGMPVSIARKIKETIPK